MCSSDLNGEISSNIAEETKVEIMVKVPVGANIRQIGCDIEAGVSYLTGVLTSNLIVALSFI